MEPDAHAATSPGRRAHDRSKQETKSGWLVVGVKGRADAEAADQLETALRKAVAAASESRGRSRALDYISSAGLRAVLQPARAAQAKNVEFAVCGMSASVKKVFDMSGMHQRADDSRRIAMLTMLEEVVLLAVDEQTGICVDARIRNRLRVSGRAVLRPRAGTKIDTDTETIHIVDRTPTGNPRSTACWRAWPETESHHRARLGGRIFLRRDDLEGEALGR